ncbi:MAG: hypothetical protein ACOX8E_05410 [Ruminococcus sp.]|jgi:hypothetical protein
MFKKALSVGLLSFMLCSLTACGAAGQQDAGTLEVSENANYESVEGTQIKMITQNTEMGVIYGAGAWQLSDIQKNSAMQEAYQMGKNIC